MGVISGLLKQTLKTTAPKVAVKQAALEIPRKAAPVVDEAVAPVVKGVDEVVTPVAAKPKDMVHVMRYEDLHENPRRCFGKLAEYLHIPCGHAQLAKAVEACSFDKLRKQEEKSGYYEKPAVAERFFRKGTAGQWRDALTKDQITAIVSQHRSQMERFDYVPEGF